MSKPQLSATPTLQEVESYIESLKQDSIDLTTFNRIGSYYDEYESILSSDKKESLIARGFLPGRLFIPRANGDVVFYWWPVGFEDMECEVIPAGSKVLCPPQWKQELKAVGLTTEVTSKPPLRSKGSICTIV